MTRAPQTTTPPPAALSALAARIDAALPQTQCTRCGYPDCASYAQAIAAQVAPINQCPPGGAEGIVRLAVITGFSAAPLSAEHGQEAPRAVAFIDEAWCIGCTLCIKACPTDAIVGSNKMMHTVIEPYCTGCELCVPVCPVDCIQLENVTGTATGWAAWAAPLAQQAQQRYKAHRERLPLDAAIDDDPAEADALTAPSVARRDDAGASLKSGGASGLPDTFSGAVGTAGASEASGSEDKAQAARKAAIAAAMERARQRREQGPR